MKKLKNNLSKVPNTSNLLSLTCKLQNSNSTSFDQKIDHRKKKHYNKINKKLPHYIKNLKVNLINYVEILSLK